MSLGPVPEKDSSAAVRSRPPALRQRLSPHLALAGRIGLLLAITVGLEVWVMRLAGLPEAAYTHPVITLELARRLWSRDAQGLATLATLAAALILALHSRSLGPAWRDLEQGANLRRLAMLAGTITAWVFATYDYNFYFDQPHHLDRLLLLAFLPLLYWRPAFVLPFLALVLAMGWQFRHPIEGLSWAAPILLIRVLFLIAAVWLVRIVTGRARPHDFVFLLCCLIAAHYWASGLGKLRLGWIQSDTVGFLLPSTYANGWLGFLRPDTIARMTRTFVALNWPMKLGTLVIECGSVLALWRLTTLRVFLAGAILFHAAAFLLSGIFFWSWILLDAFVLGLFLRRRTEIAALFTPAHFLVSIVLIGGGAVWFRPVRLSWLDARATYTHRIVGETASGRSYALPPAFFAPYDFQFTLNAFRYLVREPRLLVTWGATAHRPVAAGLQRARTPEAVLALESRLGVVSFNVGREAAFDAFMRAFVRNWNERPRERWWWEWLRAPPLLWTFPRGAPDTGGEPVVRVVVREVTSLFDDVRYLEIRDLPVHETDIPR